MATKAFDSDPGFKKVLNNLRGPDEIFAGLLGEVGEFLIKIGSALEFGTEKADGSVHIPSRPFLRETYDIHKEDIRKIIEGKIPDVLLGTMTKEKVLKLAAVFFIGKVRERIGKRPSPFIENAPATLKAKFPKDQPLIATVGRIRSALAVGFK